MNKYIENQITVPRFNEANGFYTTKKRSELMSKIKSQNTKPEMKLRKALWNFGFRYRKNVKKLPGTPDIVYSKNKLVFSLMVNSGMDIIGLRKDKKLGLTEISGFQK